MKHLKGFTLTECLIALAIIGIASLTLAQMYAGVAKVTRENEFMNISLSQQMKYVEERNNAEAIPVTGTVPSGEAASHEPVLNTGQYYVSVTGGPVNSSGTVDTAFQNNVYVYGVTMYVLYSRDIADSGTDDSAYVWDGVYTESNSQLRYKYLVARPPV
jgi:prepilin-type N-terminal cleavage/methylation domain-containing protein